MADMLRNLAMCPPFLVLLLSPPLVLGTSPDQRIRAFLEKETREISKKFLAGVTKPEEWEANRGERHRQFLEMLGLWPLPDKTPLEARVTGSREGHGFRVENLHFQSRPGLYVTGNFYLPLEVKEKLPAVLYVCGHSGRGRDGNKTAFQHHGMWFATHGYACLTIDTLQLGEVAGVHHGTYNQGRWWWQARGYTPAGVECWNGIRAIDYLETRPEVDARRIAVTGISGGGMASFWISAADDRVKVAVPTSGLSDLETYVNDRVVNGHCDCMFFINAYQWPFEKIAALVAPRPLLFANSDKDGIFPMPGNRRVAARLVDVYALLGKPENFAEVVVPGDHGDKRVLRLCAYQWIGQHLKGDRTEASEPEEAPFAGKDLRAFPDALPSDAINNSVDQVFVPRAELSLPRSREEFDAVRSRVIEKLRRLSFAPELAESPAEGFPEAPGGSEETWLAVRGAGEKEEDISWTAPHVKGAIVAFSPRGSGKNAWKEEFPWPVRRSLALLGHTVDSGRVFDVMEAVRRLRASGGERRKIHLIGRGEAGILAAYAALLGAKVDGVTIVEPPASHETGPIFLNVLRVCDIPDALGLLAPLPLKIVGAGETVSSRTRAYYEACGARRELSEEAR